MLKATKINYRGRLSLILSRLMDAVSQLSHSFYTFAAKYPITNFVGIGPSDEQDASKFGNDFEEVVPWLKQDDNNPEFCDMDDLNKLESLRTYFAPNAVLAPQFNGMFNNHAISSILSTNLIGGTTVQVKEAMEQDISKTYFEALQSLSHSRWVIYETRTLHNSRELNDETEIYHSLLSRVHLKGVRGGSIQITGPEGHGKSALIKLVSQKLKQESSVLIVENIPNPLRRGPISLYGICASFIHQIISQRPALFQPVQTLMAEILVRNAWSEAGLKTLLSSMFQHSQGVDFLVVIYDYDTWPSHIQAWWTEIKSLLPESCGSSCTFLTSSHKRLDDFAATKVRQLNLAKKFKRYRSALIRAKTSHLIAQGYGSPSLKEVLREDVKDSIISTAKSFQGSFAATTSYLTHMFGTFILSSVDTIERQIAICPQTENDLYIDEIAELGSKPTSVFFWATAVLSWMLLVARPLRIEELAAASAIISTQLSISDIQKKVSMDMERDLRTHLGGLVVIENRYARVISTLARDILCQQNPKIWKIQQRLETNSGLTELCLHYLKIVLGDESDVVWQKCLSQVSYRHQGPLLQDPALEFLDYACQFWPAHFLQVSNPDEDLIGAVIKFLKTPVVSDRWFQLYLLSTSTWSNPLSETGQASSPLASTQEAESMSSEKSISSGAAAEEKAQLSAVQMASYVGLASVIPFLLTSDGSGEVPEKIHLRHGYSERDIMLLDRGSRHYLECAIADDNDGLVKELFNIDRIGVEDCFPLHMAALAGNLKTVKALLDILPDPGKRDLEGRTPLHMAAICGRTDIISVLAGRTIPEDPPNKASINNAIDSTDNKFQTPLIIATRMGNVAAASLLVELNADVTMKDETGKTAMHYAVLNCPQVVETLLNENEDIAFIEDNDKCTAVHIAARSGHVKSIRNITNAVRIAGRLAEAVDICDIKGRTPLHYAAENGHQEVTEVLADGGESAALEDNEGKLPAELAAAHGHLATLKALNRGKLKIGDNRLLVAAAGAGQLLVVQYLLQNGVSPDGEKSSELLPLSVAASMGHVEIVSTLLRSKARINIEDSDRRTPLHHATIKGRYDVVQMLLAPPSSTNEKANISAPDSLRYTPLHHAALAGHTKIMQLLLDNYANPEARSSDSETPLHLAVEHPEAVKILLGATNNPNTVDILNKTPLHKATSRKCLRSARILIKGGANIDALDDESRRPVYHAISQNDLPMVKEIFKGQVDGIEPRDYEWDDLELAVEASSLEVLQFFINGSPQSVKQTSDRGRTLLNVAAEQHSQEVLALLLDSGSDINHSDYKGRTPLYDATATDNVENMRSLLARGADVDKADEAGDMPLHIAARRDVNESVSILIDAKSSINQPGNNKSTPLYLAAYKGKYENVKALLKSGANVNICSGNGWSPLHAGVDNLEITKLLVAHGADINHPKNDEWRPLHLAASWGYTKIVTFLLEEGADPNLKNADGETPLHVALRRVNIDVAKVLLNYEGSNTVDVHLRNAQELAPIHLAVMHCAKDVVKMLIQKGADFKSRTGNDTSCLVLAIEQNPEVLTILLDREVIVPNEFWDYQDLVLAYWVAVKKDQPECVKILVDTTTQLLDEVSAEGFNGLETHLRNTGLDDNDEQLCNRFVDLGLNPFKRRQDSQKSAFELGVMSRDKVKMKFIDSCMKFIPDDLSTSELGFRELRIATEMDTPDLWKKLELLREKSEDETDRDDWRLDHFLHQSAPRVIYAEQKEETLDQPTRTPTALILPPRWHAPDADVGARVQILPNGLEVSFKGSNDKYIPHIVRQLFTNWL